MTQSPEDGASTPTKAEPAGADDGGKSIVSRNFSIVGDLTCQDALHIDGSIEGNIACQQLTVSEAGRIKGDIRADTVDMHGALTGAIDARVLTLSKSSNVVGDIVVHETLGIEPGASFDGNCKKLGAADNKAIDDAGVDEETTGDDVADASEMEAAEPEAPSPETPSPDAATPENPSPEAPEPGAKPADAETTEAIGEMDMMSEPASQAEDAQAEGMSRALDRVAAELKARAGDTGSGKMPTEPKAEPNPSAPAPADDPPDPASMTPLPDPSEPAENFAQAMNKPATNGAAPAAAPEPANPSVPATPAGAAKPAAAPAVAPAPAKPATAPPEPAKPDLASNGAAPTG